jgi:hypothetical protein
VVILVPCELRILDRTTGCLYSTALTP